MATVKEDGTVEIYWWERVAVAIALANNGNQEKADTLMQEWYDKGLIGEQAMLDWLGMN